MGKREKIPSIVESTKTVTIFASDTHSTGDLETKSFIDRTDDPHTDGAVGSKTNRHPDSNRSSKKKNNIYLESRENSIYASLFNDGNFLEELNLTELVRDNKKYQKILNDIKWPEINHYKKELDSKFVEFIMSQFKNRQDERSEDSVSIFTKGDSSFTGSTIFDDEVKEAETTLPLDGSANRPCIKGINQEPLNSGMQSSVQSLNGKSENGVSFKNTSIPGHTTVTVEVVIQHEPRNSNVTPETPGQDRKCTFFKDGKSSNSCCETLKNFFCCGLGR